jgi:hypothetical protein
MKKNASDITLSSIGCVSALEFSGKRLSACVNITTMDLARIVEALQKKARKKDALVYKGMDKILRQQIKTVEFSAVIASGGRVDLAPVLVQMR